MGLGHVVNAVRLQQLEVSSRGYVRQHPEDMKARLELAWCLLVQALYEAGRETSAPTRLPGTTVSDTLRFLENPENRNTSHDDPFPSRSDELFRECLHQAATVQHLSTSSEDHASAKQLQALVCLSGGECALATSQQRLFSHAVAMLQDMTQPAEGSA